jgi:hypothetical protein
MSGVNGLTSFGQLSITDQSTPEGLDYADIAFAGNHIFVVGVAAAQFTNTDFVFGGA